MPGESAQMGGALSTDELPNQAWAADPARCTQVDKVSKRREAEEQAS